MPLPDATSWLLAVELDGGAQPREWIHAVTALERAGIDLVTFPDALAPRRDAEQRTLLGSDEIDTVQLAAFLATQTATIGLVPTVNLTETEPFHLSTSAATLDYASRGRAALLVRVGVAAEARNIGKRVPGGNGEDATELWREAGDAVTVIRQLWDSWEDDAIIRDVPTGRFIDRDRLHYIDFVGEKFSVKGPAIIPRPPQGQVPIAVAVTDLDSARWAAHHADIAFLQRRAHAELSQAIRTARAQPSPAVRTLVDVDINTSLEAAISHSDDAIDTWTESTITPIREGADGIRLRLHGASILDLVTQTLIPRLRAAALNTPNHTPGGTSAPAHPNAALRGRLGLNRPTSRYTRGSKETSK